MPWVKVCDGSLSQYAKWMLQLQLQCTLKMDINVPVESIKLVLSEERKIYLAAGLLLYMPFLIAQSKSQ